MFLQISYINKALLILSGVFLAVFLLAPNVSAQNTKGLCDGADLTFNESGNCDTPGQGGAQGKVNSLIADIVNIISVIVGIVAVIMIIYGGFRYITSGGDSGNVTTAKNTILYAIVGLIIVALAQAIVKFILVRINE